MLKQIYIASDHAGFQLKQNIISFLKSSSLLNIELGPQINDLGPFNDASVDYPDYAHQVCKNLLASTNFETYGILICGSGQGMAMTANKYKGIRAALCWSSEVAVLSRQHNDANVLCLSARHVSETVNFDILHSFLTTEFEGGRHLIRVQKI